MLLQIDEDVWRIAVGDDYLDAGIGYVVSGLYFRCHAASAVTALAGKDVLTDVTVVLVVIIVIMVGTDVEEAVAFQMGNLMYLEI